MAEKLEFVEQDGKLVMITDYSGWKDNKEEVVLANESQALSKDDVTNLASLLTKIMDKLR